MRLNESNIGAEVLRIDSSKITAEMNTKVVVITHSCRSSLSVKLYSVLKRDYSVIMTETQSASNQFPALDISDSKYFNAFMIVHNIKAVVLTSEWLYAEMLSSSSSICLEMITSLSEICKENGAKLIFVSVRDIFVPTDERAIFTGMDINGYSDLNKKANDILSQNAQNLVINVSTFYGTNDYAEACDFTEYVEKNICASCVKYYDNTHLIQPVLSDEIGFVLSESFEKSGSISINGNSISAYEWAQEIGGNSGYVKPLNAKQDQAENREDLPSSFPEISNTDKGVFIENKQKNCIFNLVYKLSPMDYFGGKRIAEMRIQLGNTLAKSFPAELAAKADCVIPVPKTGLYYAMGLAQGLGLPYIQALSKDTSDLRSFQVNSADVRKSIIKNKVIPIPELIKGKKIIVVDEAIFTGTTLKVVCKMLRDCGAEEIYLAIPTPQCYNQCSYYVQPKRAMLLEYVREKMLEQYFGVDSVTYQNGEDFKNVAMEFGSVCMECFFGGADQ